MRLEFSHHFEEVLCASHLNSESNKWVRVFRCSVLNRKVERFVGVKGVKYQGSLQAFTWRSW